MAAITPPPSAWPRAPQALLLLLAPGICGAPLAPARVGRGGPPADLGSGSQWELRLPSRPTLTVTLWAGAAWSPKFSLRDPGVPAAESTAGGASGGGVSGGGMGRAPQDRPGGALGPLPPLCPQAAAVPGLPANTGLCTWSLVCVCVGGAHCRPLEGRKEGSGNLVPGLHPRAQPSPSSLRLPEGPALGLCPQPDPSWTPSELAHPSGRPAWPESCSHSGRPLAPTPTTWEQLSAWALEGVLFKLRGYPLHPPPHPTPPRKECST